MGANASSYGHATDEKLVDLPLPGEDEALLDLPAPPKDDEALLDLPAPPKDDKSLLNLSKMKRRACSVDPKLASNPKRKAPPINPKTCKEGSVAMGKDNEFYVIKSGKWMKVSKRLGEKRKERIREILDRTQGARKRVAAKKAKAAQTPKRRPAKKSSKKSPAKKSSKKSPAKKSSKKSPGRPKASAKKVQTPKRGRGRPKGSKNKSKK